MNTEPTKSVLHLSVRINSVSSSHASLTLFQGTAYTDHAPNRLHALTRGMSGELVIDRAIAAKFIARLLPVQITIVRPAMTDAITEGVGQSEIQAIAEGVLRLVRAEGN